MTILDERRTSRRAPHAPPNLEAFTGDIDHALHAFAADVTYAVSMARAAVTIVRKRSAGQHRRKDTPTLE